MSLNKLLNIGFIKIGEWSLVNNNLFIDIMEKFNFQNAIYVFEKNNEILYVGKTTNSIKKRFYFYMNPGKSQNTNIGINNKLKHIINDNELVSIYVFEDKGLLKYGDFDINLAEGLEKSIIDTINPLWNGQGIKNKKLV